MNHPISVSKLLHWHLSKAQHYEQLRITESVGLLERV
jgi:hypothetical protein